MRLPRFRRFFTVGRSLAVIGLLLGFGSLAACKEWVSGIVWPEPAIIDAGPIGGPPSDAVVLFDGKDLSQWDGGDKWVIENG